MIYIIRTLGITAVKIDNVLSDPFCLGRYLEPGFKMHLAGHTVVCQDLLDVLVAFVDRLGSAHYIH